MSTVKALEFCRKSLLIGEFSEKAGGGTHQYLDVRFRGVKGAQNRFLADGVAQPVPMG